MPLDIIGERMYYCIKYKAIQIDTNGENFKM